MVEHALIDGYYAVPVNAVTINGHYLRYLNTADAGYTGPWNLIAPNGRAVDGADYSTRPHRYYSLDEIIEDMARFKQNGEHSTCGGPIPYPSAASPATMTEKGEFSFSLAIDPVRLRQARLLLITLCANVADKQATHVEYLIGLTDQIADQMAHAGETQQLFTTKETNAGKND